jgi:hypothetical protein
MKKFTVYASYIHYVRATIEAENIDEARDIAYDMDGGDFEANDDGDWVIDDVKEETE